LYFQLRRVVLWLVPFVIGLLPAVTGAQAPAQGPLRLKIVGGLADVSQYVRYEEPFWRRLEEISGGRLQAEIAPFDRSGIRAQEMLALMRLGVVPFGTTLLAIVSTEEPEFNAVSCTRFLWTPICPRRDRNDDVHHEADRRSFGR
jgi:TRAP-type C4-dicarboxylate transport system substrate-binding protein